MTFLCPSGPFQSCSWTWTEVLRAEVLASAHHGPWSPRASAGHRLLLPQRMGCPHRHWGVMGAETDAPLQDSPLLLMAGRQGVQECRMVSGRQDRADLQGELRAGTARDRVGLCHSLSLAGPRRRTLPEVPRAAVGFAAESPLPRDPVPSDPPWEPGEPDGIHCSPSKARRPMERPNAGGHLGWRWGAGESREEVGCWSHLHLRLI